MVEKKEIPLKLNKYPMKQESGYIDLICEQICRIYVSVKNYILHSNDSVFYIFLVIHTDKQIFGKKIIETLV